MSARHVLRVGTRGSFLALTQSRQVSRALTAGTGVEVELVRVSTKGDVDRRPLTSIGGTGVFVTAVRQALLDGDTDIAVHSCKDLPTAPMGGIALACIPPREDPRDALVTRHGEPLAELPAGARIGTGAPRRAAQLLRVRPDLVTVPIRGNIDTRIGRVRGLDADLDAVVLATAGLNRAGRGGDIAEVLEPDVMLPAPAQGALAVECRADDARDAAAGREGTWIGALLAAGDDPATRLAVTAERVLLRALEAGCSAPVAAYATWSEPPASGPAASKPPASDPAAAESTPGGGGLARQLTLRALAISPDGRTVVEGTASTAVDAELLGAAALGAALDVSAARGLGERLAADLISRGAGELLAAARP